MASFRYPEGTVISGTSYRVIRVLGEGGMGVVYEVEDENLEKRLIVKTLHASLGSRADLLERMRREARALAKLSHPNIVQVFRFDLTEDSLRLPYIVMERFCGRNLREHIEARGRFDWPEAVRIAAGVARALAEAHAHGIVHRDVKPENIFLHEEADGARTAKLLDFGISAFGNLERLTRDKFIGTVRYAAPEQVLAEPVTPQTDLYALGLVLYEMLAGESPFEPHDNLATMARAQMELTPPPLKIPGLPGEVRAVLYSALEKTPAGRPSSAQGVAEILERSIPARPPATSLPPSIHSEFRTEGPSLRVVSVTKFPPGAREHRALWLLATIAGGIALGAIVSLSSSHFRRTAVGTTVNVSGLAAASSEFPALTATEPRAAGTPSTMPSPPPSPIPSVALPNAPSTSLHPVQQGPIQQKPARSSVLQKPPNPAHLPGSGLK